MSKPIYVISYDGVMSKEDGNTLKDVFREAIGEPDAKVVVIPTGVKVSVLQGSDDK